MDELMQLNAPHCPGCGWILGLYHKRVHAWIAERRGGDVNAAPGEPICTNDRCRRFGRATRPAEDRSVQAFHERHSRGASLPSPRQTLSAPNPLTRSNGGPTVWRRAGGKR